MHKQSNFLSRSACTGILAVFAAPLLFAQTAYAQDRYEEREYYRYCQELARDLTGYEGRVPERYNRRNRALEGAARGAAGGTIEGFIRGESREERRRRRTRGAVIGGILGALADNAERRERQRRARNYRLELDACMRAGGY